MTVRIAQATWSRAVLASAVLIGLAGQIACGPKPSPPAVATMTTLAGQGSHCGEADSWMVGKGPKYAITDGGLVITNIDGPFEDATFLFLGGLASDPSGGHLYAGTYCALRVMDLQAKTVTTLAGDGECGSVDQIGASARLFSPFSIALASNAIYVAEATTSRIRRIGLDGSVSTIAGAGSPGFRDGPAATAQFGDFYVGSGLDLRPSNGLWVTSSGDIYVADRENHRIRKISGGAVSTVAGTGQIGSSNGPAMSASFTTPTKVVGDGKGKLWVADGSAIRSIDAAGMVTTWAGDPNSPGHVDGLGTAARFTNVTDMALGTDGSLFVVDFSGNFTSGGSGSYVRKVDPAGEVSTIAGTGLLGYEDGPALAVPVSGYWLALASDQKHIYISEDCNRRVRLLTLP